MRERWCPSLLGLALLGACASGDSDAGDDTTGGDDSSGGADLCAARDGSTTLVAETPMTTTYPTPAGGTLTDGTWDLTAFEVYSPAQADDTTRMERLVIDGDTLVDIQEGDAILGAYWTTQGTNLVFTVDCPQTATVTVPYTATATEIVLFDPTEPNLKRFTRR